MSSDTRPLVALIGTLDTKQTEYQFATTWLQDRGCNVAVFDASTRDAPEGSASGSFEIGTGSKLYRAKELLEGHSSRGRHQSPPTERDAVRDALQSACLHELGELQAQGAVDAIASFGGSQNTAFATSIMRDSRFPIGLPKFMLTTMASGDVSEYLGESDICIMPSVGDISGSLNAITRTTLQNALAAISGMAHTHLASRRAHTKSELGQKDHKPLVAISMFGVTTVGVNQISDLLKDKGYEPVAFHATGSGGRTMERLIREGFFCAVIDLTTTELCDHLYDGVLSAGPDRLTAAAAYGIPQVVSLGALDMINFGSLASLPSRYELEKSSEKGPMHHTKDGAQVYEHNSQVTLVRTSSDQCRELGTFLVGQLVKGVERRGRDKEAAPIRILSPQAGISAMDGTDGVWDNPEARDALLDGIQGALQEHAASRDKKNTIQVVTKDSHINSPEFAQAVVDELLRII
ncbi:UPF0261 domain protein [Moesziomyces antarcticus]|uniref:UPF0261 domain protein n=2 Tax=Pseudozyma antarctica TaxID=84753 RepID=A0A081CFI2_PSEA2|nr:UPF0261 domain protein [Moesziomyces antarcticus]GAK65428.1 UPF0261 domain protein [Moesziomyces antarcticus]SPO46438.1 related to UPF0261 protein SACE_5696 [Moesziomyces antarcticus]